MFNNGDIDEAIQYAERSLELNPNDNQGIRTTLLNIYLTSKNLEGACRLFDEYDDGYGDFALPNWCRVLERILSNDLVGAKKALENAHKKNKHVLGFLTGRKKMPKQKPNSYALGTIEEAICCIHEILISWLEHPDALDWLRSQKVAKNKS